MGNNSLAKQAMGIAKNTFNFSRAAVRRMPEVRVTVFLSDDVVTEDAIGMSVKASREQNK